MSTATAGRANGTDDVGTVVITRSATIYEQGKPREDWPTYTSSWRPTAARLHSITPLLMPIPITGSALSDLAQQFDAHEHTDCTLEQLDPLGLNHADAAPQVHDLTGDSTSLLTASTFLVGTTDDQFAAYACIEMDDAIVAAACVPAGIEYGSVRNLSDPAQNPALEA